MSIALLGCGYWGKILSQNIVNLGYNIDYCYDIDSNNRISGAEFRPIEQILENDNVSIVVIATPPSEHFTQAKAALEAGKHVFVEKPLSMSYKEACELDCLAKKKGLTLGVDQTFLFTPEIIALKPIIEFNKFGAPKIFRSERSSFGKFQKAGVLADLLIHDASILLKLFRCPTYVSATGYSNKEGVYEDANIHYSWSDSSLVDFRADIHVSWWNTNKVRKIELVTDRGVLDTEFNGDLLFTSFEGKENLIEVTNTGSALETELNDFFESVKQNKMPYSNGRSAAIAVLMVEKAIESCNKGGAEVIIS